MEKNHRKDLATYLQDKKLNKASQVDQKKKASSTNAKAGKFQRKEYPVLHRKATVHDIPREILLYNIFPYLGPQDLTSAAQVCRDWHEIASDNYLWRPFYERYGGNTKKSESSTKPSENRASATVKENCMKRCVTHRNKRVLHRLKSKQKNPYTGLPNSKDIHQALQVTGGVSWQLCLIDRSDREHCLTYQDATYHMMTVSLRWFELETLALDDIKEIRVYSINPLFYDANAQKFIEHGPYQRSLLLSQDLTWRKLKKEIKPVAGDDLINICNLTDRVVMATFKREEAMAFIAVSFSVHDMVEKCLYGDSKCMFSAPDPKPLFDDFISNFGLMDYSMTVQLRTMKQGVWDQQFRSLDCKKDFVNNFARFNCLNSGEQIFVVKKEFEFPWKTTLFKGKIQKTIWLDVVVLDDSKNVFWTVSTVIPVKDKDTSAGHDFDMGYSGGTVQCINHRTEHGEINIELSKMEQGDYFVTECELLLSLEAINNRFGTKYGDITKNQKHKVK